MYMYESSEQGDLSFQQGDIVTVTRKEGDWWTGTIGGKTGVFPSNYVKPRDSASEVRINDYSKDVLDCNDCVLLGLLDNFLFFILVFRTSRKGWELGKETR